MEYGGSYFGEVDEDRKKWHNRGMGGLKGDSKECGGITDQLSIGLSRQHSLNGI